jgi:ABC-type transport system involved in cytochrome c biogenesis permease subunit
MMMPRWGWLALVFALLAACSRPVARLEGELERRQPWPADFVARFGELPVQYEGRCMPVSTLAAFTLYAVHGQRDVRFVAPDAADAPDGEQTKLSPTEWLLDVWCYPEQAQNYPLFRIENVGVLGQLGIEHQGQKQGFEYLSYTQLLEAAQKLEELANRFEDKTTQERSEVEEQVVQLFRQLLLYDHLHNQLAMLHGEFPIEGDKLREAFGGRVHLRLTDVLLEAGTYRSLVANEDNFKDPQYGNLERLRGIVDDCVRIGRFGAFFPPADAKGTAWLTLGDVVEGAVRGRADVASVGMAVTLQDALLADKLADQVAGLRKFQDAVEAASGSRDECSTVALESYYYRANWHFHAMMTFVLGFLIAVVCCVLPRNRWLWLAAMLTTAAAVCMLTADIWMRCLITGYGPIQRLYDTFLFIAGGSALVLLITEWVLPRRIALVLAPFLGALLILFARLFEVADGADTMKPLLPVLLSNFWLAVHVPTINTGYLSGLAASALGCAWVAMRVLRLAHPDSSLAKALVRMGYGVTCFSLATAVVGTILGGVWANDSWGRFWGWDPKENGALLICLSHIALLHARMSGMVRDAGFMLWSVATGGVIVFSWFHTNLLGVGLHAYGFSNSLHTGVWTSYMILGGILLAGGLDVLLRPKPAPLPASLDAPPLPDPEPALD